MIAWCYAIPDQLPECGREAQRRWFIYWFIHSQEAACIVHFIAVATTATPLASPSSPIQSLSTHRHATSHSLAHSHLTHRPTLPPDSPLQRSRLHHKSRHYRFLIICIVTVLIVNEYTPFEKYHFKQYLNEHKNNFQNVDTFNITS